MVNPLLTLLFDLFLIGGALAIVAAMVQEYMRSRTPSVGDAEEARRRVTEAARILLAHRRTAAGHPRVERAVTRRRALKVGG